MLDLFSAAPVPLPLPAGRALSMLQKDRLRRRHRQSSQRAGHRLFLAVLPDADTAARIDAVARHLRVSHGLSGKPVRPEHFHVALHLVDQGRDRLPADLIDLLKDRVSGVSMPAFRVAFDRAESFRNGALVLRGDEGAIGLDVLQQRLSDALDTTPRPARPFTPHVTLLRDQHRVPEQAIEPIEWTVREVVLVHSLLGQPTHRHLARWSLSGG